MKPMHRLLTLALVFCSVPLAARTDDAPVLLGGAPAPLQQSKTRGELARAAGILNAQLAYVTSVEGELALARLAKKTLAAGAAGAGGILTFDDPGFSVCGFGETAPVHGVVEGVAIQGRVPHGGAILDDCANFGVSALSFPNFLAFNSGATYQPGVFARLPESFQLPGTFSSVSVPLSGGGEPGYPMSIVAFGPSGIVDSVDLVTTSGWVTHTVSGPGITGFLLLGSPLWLVVDDVQYQ
jgi:hypothetical protein